MTRNRIAWVGAWSRDHNNKRYTELLPRLTNVDRYYVDLHPWWPVRGFRRRIELPLRSIALGLKYPLMFCTDWRQVRLFRAPCVVDHDDPVYAPVELAALSRPNVKAIVVTTVGVRNRLLAAGIRKRIEIIPQGITPPIVDAARLRAIREEWKSKEGEVVVGIHQPHFEFSDELDGASNQQMYAVDDLFAVMKKAYALNPRLVLWLVGNPSERVVEFALRNPWVRLLGYRSGAELMDYVSSFDIGIYPRRGDMGGRSSIKVLEYMACGVPVTGFDVEEIRMVLDAGFGDADNVASGPEELAKLIDGWSRDETRRKIWGELGKKAAQRYHWDRLAFIYQELLSQQENFA
jgi:glycosyltransferase involved in cell wall biosynthesis